MSLDQIQESIYKNQSSEPAHYERKPAILNFLTYIQKKSDSDDNKIFYRSRLKPVDIEVYMIIKRLAGKQVCIRDTKYIARLTGCSVSTIVKSKKKLSQSFEQLNGKSLISITEKMVETRIEDGEKVLNKRPVHIVQVNDIWAENNIFMDHIDGLKANDEGRLPPEMSVEISFKEAEIAIEKMGQDSIKDHVNNSGAYSKNGMSLGARSKNGMSSPEGTFQKWNGHKTPILNPIVKTQNPTEDPLVTSVKLSFLYLIDEGNCFASQSDAWDWLTGMGIRRKKATEIVGRFSLQELETTALYVRQQHEAGKKLANVEGFYIKALENRWWRPKAD